MDKTISKEDKILLIKDLSMRMPHGVWISLEGIEGKFSDMMMFHYYHDSNTPDDIAAYIDFFRNGNGLDVTNFKPMLRRMEDMSDKEKEELTKILSDDVTAMGADLKEGKIWDNGKGYHRMHQLPELEFYLSHHIDINNRLLDKGLAKEVKRNHYFDD